MQIISRFVAEFFFLGKTITLKYANRKAYSFWNINATTIEIYIWNIRYIIVMEGAVSLFTLISCGH